MGAVSAKPIAMRRIFYNSWLAKCLLWSGYSTAMLFGYICTKRKSSSPLSYETKQHESIHSEQYYEVTMLAFLVALILQIIFGGGWWFVPVPVMYYVLYFLEAAITWTIRLCTSGWTAAAEMAYDNSMFEQEARAGEDVSGYIETRKFLAFIRFFGKI